MKKILITFIIFFAGTLTVQAADLSLVAPLSINIGKQFSVDIKLDTSGVSINSVDIGVIYPKNLLTFKGYQEEGGIVKLWLKKPEDKGGIIELSGIIPGGVEGTYNPNKVGLEPLSLVRLLFIAKEEGKGTLAINHSSILINDGKGTELAHNKNGTTINILNSPNREAQIKDEKNIDIQAPEPFNIGIIESGYFSRTPSMIIFTAVDILSGIEKYEMKNGGEWTLVSSPLPIQRNFFSKEIRIRAIDYNGNIRESSIVMDGILSTNSVIFIIILLIILARLCFVWYKKRI